MQNPFTTIGDHDEYAVTIQTRRQRRGEWFMLMSALKSRIRPVRNKAEADGGVVHPADDLELRKKLVQRLVNWAEKSGQKDIRAERQGLMPPEAVRCELSGRKAVPDMVADKNGVGMLYAVETCHSIDAKATALKLCGLSSHARKKVMLFVIAVPRDCGDLAEKRIEELGLDAQVLEIDI